MRTYVDMIANMVGLSDEPALAEHDWDAQTERLGVPIPEDYKELVNRFGAGQFDEFLWIFEPDSGNPNLNLAVNITERQEGLAQLWADGEPLPNGVDVGDRLICFAATDNGDYFYWQPVSGAAPDAWTILINESRGPSWYRHEGPATALLYRLLTGEIEVDMFEGYLPRDVHTFHRIDS